MRQARTERRDLIEACADVSLTKPSVGGQSWTSALGTPPEDQRAATTRRRLVRAVAAFRDRNSVAGPAPLGALAESTAQKIGPARARSALDRA